MQKKMLFDLLSAQPSGSTKFHGGGEYIKFVLKKLLEDYSEYIEIQVFYNKNEFLDEWLEQLLSSKNVVIHNVASVDDIKEILLLERFDVFYSGLPYRYDIKLFPYLIKKVGTFHGLRPIECPGDSYEFAYIAEADMKHKIKSLLYSCGWSRPVLKPILKWYYTKQYNAALDCFDVCIVVSEHTKYAVSNYFPQYKEKLKVCYSPAKETKDVLVYRQITKRYILIISANRWLKNSYRAVYALDDMYERNLLCDVDVIVVGLGENSFMNLLKHKDRFHIKGYVSAEELENLYKNCSVFLYPTLNEGFGYPPLEAMKYGRTCIVSAVCSLPEICGDAVYYINPYDLGEIQTRILEALENPLSGQVILRQRNKILKQQNEDLDKLCSIIVYS